MTVLAMILAVGNPNGIVGQSKKGELTSQFHNNLLEGIKLRVLGVRELHNASNELASFHLPHRTNWTGRSPRKINE